MLVNINLKGDTTKVNVYTNRLVGVFVILAGFSFSISLSGIMVTHPMIKTIHSALHLLLAVSGLLLFIGLLIYLISYRKWLGITVFAGIALILLGNVLYITGGFNYAILHGWLNKISINDPLHQVPLNLAPYPLSLGILTFGIAIFKRKKVTLFTAIFLVLSALTFLVGWQLIGFSMIRYTNKSRYIKALLVTLPIGFAWCCFGFEQLIRPSKKTS